MFKWSLRNTKTKEVYQLSRDPKGWEDLQLQLYRSDTYHGIFFAPTQKALAFLPNGGGFEFIENIYRTEDVNGSIELTCLYKGTGTIFKQLFKAILNLASYSKETDRITLSMEQSDLYQKLLSRDEISVDMESETSIGQKEITPAVTKQIVIPSQMVRLVSESEAPKELQNTIQSFDFSVIDNQVKGFFTLGWDTLNTELPEYKGWNDYSDWGVSGFTSKDTGVQPILRVVSDEYKYPLLIEPEIFIKGTLTIIPSTLDRQLGNIRLNLAWGPSYDQAITNNHFVTLVDHDFDTDALINIDLDVQHTTPLSMYQTDGLWLVWVMTSQLYAGDDAVNNTFRFNYSNDNPVGRNYIRLRSDTYSVDFNTKTVLIHEALNQIADAIADSDGNLYSDLYGRTTSLKRQYDVNGEQAHLAVTNGLNIRGKDSPISISLKETFTSLNTLHNIGLGILDDKIRVEKKGFFYRGDIPMHTMPFVNSIQTTNANDRYANQVLVGYDAWETEYRQGLDDVHGKREYSTALATVKRIYNLISSFISSSYAIEVTKRKKNVTETTDWRYDNNSFWLALKDYYKGRIIFAKSSPPVKDLIALPLLPLNQFEAGDTIEISNAGAFDGTYTIAEVTVNEFITELRINELLPSGGSVEFAVIKNNTRNLSTLERYSDAFSDAANMISYETANNLRLTAERMLVAHMNVIASGLQLIHGAVKYIKGDGNTLFEVKKTDVAHQEDYSGSLLAENSDIAWNDSNVENIKPLWGPELYEFSYPLTEEQFTAIMANPYGYFEFWETQDDIKRGFIVEMDYKLKGGLTKFKLLKRHD